MRVAALVCIAVLLAVALASVLGRGSHSQAAVPGNAAEIRQALVPPGESPRGA